MNNYIKAIIVDDELDGRLVLTSLLTDHCESIKLLGSFDSAESGIKAIRLLNPDLVFLDIEMPGMNAFEMLEQLDMIHFDVVFVTAYDHYALKAIKHNALEYILKPVDKVELIKSIEKFHSKWQSNRTTQESDSSKMVLSVREGFLFIDVAKIIRCEGDGNYTHVYLEGNVKHTSSKSLKEFERILPSSGFIRIHKSHLINTNFIKKYIKGEGGTIVMADNSELEVSRRKKDYFLKYFNIRTD
ncbi:MAG: LytR/AlgR family response regulator transcription factor [Cytophagaceae bacterium]